MSEFNFNGNKIHYEVYGEGKPFVVLNGIMMSTNSWKPFIKAFSQSNKLILLDFLDQGQSARMTSEYKQAIQADVVAALLGELKIKNVAVMGISYGGEVALQFVLKYPHLVERLVLANTAARTSCWLAEIGHNWNAAAATGDGRLYYLTTIPIIYSTAYYERRIEWMKQREKTLVPYFSNKAVLESLIRLTNSSEGYDVVDRLGEIKCPTLIISADADIITPITEQDIIHNGIKGSTHVLIKESGHASMYEQPDVYAALTLGFVNLNEPEIVI